MKITRDDDRGKILVTGATGFIGSYITRELTAGNYNVRALRRSTSVLPQYIDPRILSACEWVEGDVLDPLSLEDALQGVSSVIHAAAVVSFNRRDKKLLHHVNEQGTANVVNAMIACGVERLTHISSVAAIGRSAVSERVAEDKRWEENGTQTEYAISKYRSEMEVWRGEAEGLSTVIVNPSTVLGYGDWNQSSCRIFKSLYHEFPWYSTGVNGFVDVTDVARAVRCLHESDIRAERFIVNADNLEFRQLFNAIADAFGKKRPHIRATPLMSAVAWRLQKLKAMVTSADPLVTKETARVANAHTFFSNDKLLTALPGFSFTPLEETVKTACRQYVEGLRSGRTSA